MEVEHCKREAHTTAPVLCSPCSRDVLLALWLWCHCSYKGMVDCFRKSVVSEGPLSLWKGFWPNFGRIGPRVTIIFVIMEQMRHAFDGKKKKEE